jgi:hypothetical protein
MSIVFICLAAVVAIASAAFVYTFVAEYGPTTGSRLDGAKAGLGIGAFGLVVVAVFAVGALVIGRRWLVGRIAAVAVLAAALLATLATGAQAAVVKYDSLPTVPNCTAEGAYGSAGTTIQDAFAQIPHPQPFGAGWSSVSGCGADLLNLRRDEAAAYYREKLPAAGWTIARDDATGLRANRGDLVFTLSDECGAVTVAIEQAAIPGTRVC